MSTPAGHSTSMRKDMLGVRIEVFGMSTKGTPFGPGTVRATKPSVGMCWHCTQTNTFAASGKALTGVLVWTVGASSVGWPGIGTRLMCLEAEGKCASGAVTQKPRGWPGFSLLGLRQPIRQLDKRATYPNRFFRHGTAASSWEPHVEPSILALQVPCTGWKCGKEGPSRAAWCWLNGGVDTSTPVPATLRPLQQCSGLFCGLLLPFLRSWRAGWLGGGWHYWRRI